MCENHLSDVRIAVPQAPADAIASTVAALRTEVDVGGVFAARPGAAPGSIHRLRCALDDHEVTTG